MEGTSSRFTSRTIEGCEVVEAVSGAVLGTVFDTLIDLEAGKLEYLGILPASWYQGGTVLPVEKVLGHDEGVLLIERASHLISLQSKESKPRKKLVGIRELRNRIVIDKSGLVYGRLLGVVFGDNGRIVGLEVEKDILERTVPVQKVIAIGEKYIIIDVAKEAHGIGREGESEKKSEEKGGEVGLSQSLTAEKVVKVAKAHTGSRSDLSTISQASKFQRRSLEKIVNEFSPVSFVTDKGEEIVRKGERLTPMVLNRLLGEGLLHELLASFPEEEPTVTS